MRERLDVRYAGRIEETYVRVRPVVVRLDVLKVGCGRERWVVPVQLTHPQMNRGVSFADTANVALKVAVVHWVKANLERV